MGGKHSVEARRAWEARQPDRLDDATKDRILAHFASGGTTRTIASSGICSYADYKRALRNDEAFRLRCQKQFGTTPLGRRYRDQVATKRSILTLARDGTSLRQIVAMDTMPSEIVIAKWRKQDPIFDRLLVKALEKFRPRFFNESKWRDPVSSGLLPDAAKALVVAIEGGSHIGKRTVIAPGLPNGVTLLKMRRVDKKLDKLVLGAVAMRDRMRRNRAIMLGERKAPAVVRRGEWIANPDKLYLIAKNAVPSSYPAHIRDDIISSVILAALEGRVMPEEIAAEAKRQATAYWRERPEYRLRSMDAQRFDDGKATLHDTVTTSLWEHI